ncbi:MAG: hypothetical protein ACOCUL_02490 [Bacteroidota bacterium]
MTLQDAIIKVFVDKNAKTLSVKTITEHINNENLFQRNDKGIVPENQVLARIQNFPDIFSFINPDQITLKDKENKLLQSFNNELISLLNESHILANEVLLVSFYFAFRIKANPIKFSFIFKDVEIDTSSFTSFYLELLNSLNKSSTMFYEHFNHLIKTYQEIHVEEFDNKINYLFSKINLSEEEIPDNIFNLFIYETVLKKYFRRYENPSIPINVVNIIDILLAGYDCSSLFIPRAGTCSLPILLKKGEVFKQNFSGNEINDNNYAISLMILFLNGFAPDNFYHSSSYFPIVDKKYDLIFTGFSFGKRVSDIPKNIPIKSNDETNLTIQSNLNYLNKNGKAIFIVPENFLFSEEIGNVALKKKLIDEYLLEKVISLPINIFQPFLSIKTSILVISNKKNEEVEFINLEDSFLKNEQNELVWDSQAIKDLLEEETRSEVVSEPRPFYKNQEKDLIRKEKIYTNEFNLVVKRYLQEPGLKDDNIVEFQEICKSFEKKRSRNSDYPYVNIKNLNKEFYGEFQFHKLEINNSGKEGYVVDFKALLVGSIEGSFKPTLFDFQDNPVLVSPHIYAFKIDEKKIIPEYLIYELASTPIEKQLASKAYGATSLKRIRLKDILTLQIHCPPIDEQEKVLKNKKEIIYSSKFEEVSKLADKLGLAKNSEIDLFGSLKHELGNIIGGVSNDIKNLKNALDLNNVDTSLKISKRTEARTIEETFQVIGRNLQDISLLMDNMQNVININKTETQLQRLNFKHFFQEEVQKLTDILHHFNFYYSSEDKKITENDPEIFLDKHQFGLLIRNFVYNSFCHGYDWEKTKKGKIIFNLSTDEDYYYISLINDGQPFPIGFSLLDFLTFGKRFDSSKGSGIGGFLVGKVVENHEGKIELMEPGTFIFLEKNEAGSHFPNFDLMRVGVHFYIQIPKTT